MTEPQRIGQQLGNYRLARLLGAGGFAEVYLGEHVHLKTEAAIKVLHTRLEQEDAAAFGNEARTIARLKHLHIVRVLDFGIEGTLPYLVMDYAPQGSLRSRHARGTQLPLEIALSYVRQLAGALQYAHDRKLIHRDLKPENILVDESGDLVLSDFGIATIAQSSRSQNTQDIVGTAARTRATCQSLRTTFGRQSCAAGYAGASCKLGQYAANRVAGESDAACERIWLYCGVAFLHSERCVAIG